MKYRESGEVENRVRKWNEKWRRKWSDKHRDVIWRKLQCETKER